MNHTIPVTVAQIISGLDSGMTPARLHWGDSVTYVLDAEAAAGFRYKPKDQVITLTCEGGCKMSCVEINRTDTKLEVVMLKDTLPWDNGKATLFFDAVGRTQPAPGGLDPVVDNHGKPG